MPCDSPVAGARCRSGSGDGDAAAHGLGIGKPDELVTDDVVRHKLIRLPDAEAARRGMTVTAA